MRAENTSTSFINTQLEKLQRNYALMVALLLLFICVIVWMLISVVQTKDSSEITTSAQKYVTSINPNLDTTTMASLALKRVYSDEELSSFPIYVMLEDESGSFAVVPLGTTRSETAAQTSNSSSGTSGKSASPASSSGQLRTNSTSVTSGAASSSGTINE